MTGDDFPTSSRMDAPRDWLRIDALDALTVDADTRTATVLALLRVGDVLEALLAALDER